MGPKTFLKWDAVPGASRYIVFYRSDKEAYDPGRKLISDVPQTALNQLDGVYPPGTVVSLTVAICDLAQSLISYLSAEVSFALPFPAPQNLIFS